MKLSYIFTLLFMFNNLFASITCSSEVNNLNFGTYDIYDFSDTNSISDFTVTCQGQVGNGNNNAPSWLIGLIYNGTEVNVVAYPSEGNSGDSNNRYMTNNIDNMNYNLYNSSNLQNIFNQNSPININMTLDSSGEKSVTENYYGSIPNSQKISSGVYYDNLNMIIEY